LILTEHRLNNGSNVLSWKASQELLGDQSLCRMTLVLGGGARLHAGERALLAVDLHDEPLDLRRRQARREPRPEPAEVINK